MLHRILASGAIAAAFINPNIFVLADDLHEIQGQEDDRRTFLHQGIMVNFEKEGSISIHAHEAELSSSDVHHYGDDKHTLPSLKVHPLSFNLSERCDEGLISIKMPDGSTKKMKNMITVPQEALGGNTEISQAYWYGEDANDGSTFNYIRGVDGSIHGSILDMTAGTISQLRVDSKGNPIAVKRFSDDFPDEEDVDVDVDVPIFPNFEQHLHPVSDHRNLNNDSEDMGTTDDSGKMLDIMVVWTEKSENAAGGTKGMQNTINLAIEETNTAYTLSGIDLKLNLVHSYKSTINEPASINIALLESLKTNSDVKSKREEYGADVVVLLATSSKSCGLGYVNFRPGQSKKSSKNHFFSVVRLECATGNFSFGHEIGHNLGARHDRGQEALCGDSYSYNYGHRHPGKFRSMMSYACARGTCDIKSTSTCNRVQRFSGPDVKFNGSVGGSSKKNNVRQINKVKATAASFFSHKGGGGGESGSPSGSHSFDVVLYITLLVLGHFALF